LRIGGVECGAVSFAGAGLWFKLFDDLIGLEEVHGQPYFVVGKIFLENKKGGLPMRMIRWYSYK
jgi:hypothetical protein